MHVIFRQIKEVAQTPLDVCRLCVKRNILTPRTASKIIGTDLFALLSLQALFSRLLLPDPGNHLIYMTSCSAVNLSADRDAGEKSVVPYLFACYQRAKEEVQEVVPSETAVIISHIRSSPSLAVNSG